MSQVLATQGLLGASDAVLALATQGFLDYASTATVDLRVEGEVAFDGGATLAAHSSFEAAAVNRRVAVRSEGPTARNLQGAGTSRAECHATIVFAQKIRVDGRAEVLGGAVLSVEQDFSESDQSFWLMAA